MTEEDLRQAGEVFISSTGGGVIAVTTINDKPVGNGAPGLTTGKLGDMYWKKRAEGWGATALDDLLEDEISLAAGAD